MAESDSSSISARVARMLRLGRSDDPISSLKAVTRWADNLTLGDPLKAQGDILAELKRFNESNEEPSKERLLILMTLDEKAQDLQKALSRQYLRNSRMSRVTESELWHAIYHLNWEVLRGYHTHVFSHYRNKGGSDFAAMIPLITLRALRGFRNVIKWRSLRYMHPGEKTWVRLHQLYQIAENQNFHQTRLFCYPDDVQERTCEAEYLHVLMLDQTNSGSQYPRQIDLIDQWLSGWCDNMRLDQILEVGRHILSVDLSRDQGARRVRNTGSEHTTRYWSTVDLLNQIKGIQNEIHAGTAPARLGLTENIGVAESLELLGQLVRQWGVLSAREQRRKPRAPVKKVVEIVQGFPAILAHVLENQFDELQPHRVDDKLIIDETIDMQIYGFVTGRTSERLSKELARPVLANAREVERWVMEDESECGYGTTTQTRDKDWLRVGALVGLRTDKMGEWVLAVVRRLSRISETESSVGFETLPGNPQVVNLQNRQEDAGYDVNGTNISQAVIKMHGLILNEGSQPALLLDPVHYRRKAILEYNHPSRKTIRLGDPIEQGEGWLMCQILWLD